MIKSGIVGTLQLLLTLVVLPRTLYSFLDAPVVLLLNMMFFYKVKVVVSFLIMCLRLNKLLGCLLFLLLRSTGRSMLHKRAKVEFYPLGVIGAIVSWNYPFHNVFNPMLATVFSGNAAVIKVASLSSTRMRLFILCTLFIC